MAPLNTNKYFMARLNEDYIKVYISNFMLKSKREDKAFWTKWEHAFLEEAWNLI